MNPADGGIRYNDFYTNKSRGLRKKAGTDDDVPALIDSGASSKEFRKNWVRLIQKIYHADPLLCSKCLGSMRIISFVEDADIYTGVKDNFFLHRYNSSKSNVPAFLKVASANWISASN